MLIKYTARTGKTMVAVFFLLVFVAGILTAGQFGISWDEHTETEILISNMRYVAQTLLPKAVVDQQLTPVLNLFYYERVLNASDVITQSVERDHGQAVYYPSAVLFFAIYHMKKADPELNVEHALYLGRHIYNFIVCFLGWLCLYMLLKRLTGKRIYGIIGVVVLLLSPRFLADSFYNNKDMIAFITCIFMMYGVWRFYEKETNGAAVASGIAGAFAINTRVSLALFLLLAVVYYVFVKVKSKSFGWNEAARIGVAFISVALTYYVITPAAWKDPVSLVKYVFENAVYFGRWNGYVYYLDSVYHPSDIRLPWHYLPVMITVTTPVLFLILLCVGFVRSLKNYRKIRELQLDSSFGFFALTGIFSLISLAVPVLFRSNVYNGWRHLFYIYSGFLLLIVYGFQWLLTSRRKWVQVTAIVCLLIQAGSIGAWMTRNHPYEYAYYNALAGTHPEERFEQDYWNTSQASLIKRLMADNPEGKVCLLYSTTYCATIDYVDYFLTGDEKKRLKLYNLDYLEGVITTYLRKNPAYLVINPSTAKKMHVWGWPLYFDDKQTVFSDLKPAYEILVDGTSIQQLYKLTNDQVLYLLGNHT